MTMDRVLLLVVVAGLGLVLLWLAALTVEQRRTRDRLGEPVYHRLPGGRLAFSWSTHNAYQATRRGAGAESGRQEGRTGHP